MNILKHHVIKHVFSYFSIIYLDLILTNSFSLPFSASLTPVSLSLSYIHKSLIVEDMA